MFLLSLGQPAEDKLALLWRSAKPRRFGPVIGAARECSGRRQKGDRYRGSGACWLSSRCAVAGRTEIGF